MLISLGQLYVIYYHYIIRVNPDVICSVKKGEGGGVELQPRKLPEFSPGQNYSWLFCFYSRSYGYFCFNIFHILIYFQPPIGH